MLFLKALQQHREPVTLGANVKSANVAMRKKLDLFANMRPVKVPEEGIDWTFFRENTEGGYAIGSYD